MLPCESATTNTRINYVKHGFVERKGGGGVQTHFQCLVKGDLFDLVFLKYFPLRMGLVTLRATNTCTDVNPVNYLPAANGIVLYILHHTAPTIARCWNIAEYWEGWNAGGGREVMCDSKQSNNRVIDLEGIQEPFGSHFLMKPL